MMPIEAPVLVVGGGIGGLATALALSRKGIPVQVLEQAPEFKEIGAGIQLGPNVFRMFEVLGLTEEMFRWSAFPDGLEFRDSITGETVIELPIDKQFHDKYRAPYGVIHRADMLNVILDACKQSNLIKLTTSQKVVAINDDGSGITAKTETGETYTGAALVGCDGLWSTVRETIVGDGKPVVSGHIAYRAVLPTADWPTEYRMPKMIIWCGEKTHLVHYPLRRGELFNLVVVFHSDRYEEGWDTYGDPAELHERFKDKCEPVRTLLQKVNAWKMWVLCDRPAIKNWTKGRITLLGDAAHPMLQYLAQGGNMAMEDAVCLANQVEADGRRLRGGVQEIPGAALSAHRARAAHGAGVRRDLSRQRRQPRAAQQGAARMDRGRAASTCRGSTASSRSCRMSQTCRCRRRRGWLPDNTFNSSGRKTLMAKLDDLLEDLVTANHVLAKHGIVDSFGHVSIRHPDNPDRFSCRARARPNGSSATTSSSSLSKASRSTPRASTSTPSAPSTAAPIRRGPTSWR